MMLCIHFASLKIISHAIGLKRTFYTLTSSLIRDIHTDATHIYLILSTVFLSGAKVPSILLNHFCYTSSTV